MPTPPAPLGFTLADSSRLSLKKLWDASTKAELIAAYFADKAEGDIAPGTDTVLWHWKGYPPAELTIVRCVKYREFVFQWKAWEHNYSTTVRISFEKKGSRTVVRVQEYGFKKKYLEDAFDHAAGWGAWLMELKAFVKYGESLRK